MRRQRRRTAAVVAALGLALVGGLVVTAPATSGAAPAGEPSARMSAGLQHLADGGGQAGQRSAVPAPVRQGGAYDPAATGPGSLIQTDEGVLVQVFSDELTSALERRLRGAGATIVHSDRTLGIATARVPIEDLGAVAAVDGVRYLAEVPAPVVGGRDGVDAAGLAATVQAACGAAHSEGDAQLHADALRATWDTEGSGVEVGILSDSWDASGQDRTSAAQDVASGDLPGAANPCPGPGRTTPATVVAEGPADATDEGRAMGQLVHDLAPAARLSFATAYGGDLDFAANIRRLRDRGAKVIVDDVFYFNEPAYQNGPIGVAVDDVIASGTSYFSALGNENEIIAGHPVASYEAQAFRPAPCPAGIPGTCHDFEPGSGTDATLGFTVPAGGKLNLTLKWDEPWNGVVTDYDLYYLVDGAVAASSRLLNPGGTQQPYEVVTATVGGQATNVEVVVARRDGATTAPRFRLEHIRSDLIGAERLVGTGGDVIGPDAVGHPVVPRAVALGAVPASDSSAVEPFSSRGPATWYWGPVVGSTPASRLAAPQLIPKPDLAATDRVQTTFFYDRTPPYDGPFVFAGTSAAAPHAAAVAALLRACNPALTPDQLKQALQSTAAPVAGGEPETVGAGLVSAKAAGDLVCQGSPQVPRFSISDASVVEGTSTLLSGTRSVSFTVTLSQPVAATTSVTYQTVDGTAAAGTDYTAKAPTVLTFSKGQTSKTITIKARSDSVHEPDETFAVRLSAPVGAGIADDLGMATIVDDDPLPPEVAISDATVVEGSSTSLLSTRTITFTVTLSHAAAGTTSVVYQTIDGTATAGSDYTAKKATKLSFSKGQTSKTITVTVKQDKLDESDEVFFVVLSNGVGLHIADDVGTGVILDDD
jgi:hypothetical protein